jgi:hypothetical protein
MFINGDEEAYTVQNKVMHPLNEDGIAATSKIPTHCPPWHLPDATERERKGTN